MTTALPRVPDPSPPAHFFDGVEIPRLWMKFTPQGKAWFRNIKIPIHRENAIFGDWKKNKRAWLARGFSVTKTDGVWSFNQWLTGPETALTLTMAGADILAAHDKACAPVQAAMVLAPAELVFPELPDGMEAKLMPHQIQPARQLLRALQQGKAEWGYSGALDLSVVGSGKTYATLCAALATGRSVGVICPPAGRKGWLAAFKHFGAEPEFLSTYEAVRGEYRSHIAERNADGVFRWKNPDDIIIIMDEAHACFPYWTMIATDRGTIPIGQLVDEKLTLNVWTYDIITHTTTLRPVVNWFRNPPSGLVTVHHQYGSFTCTADHRIFTRTRGWIQARDLSPHDYLSVLSADVPQDQARPVLRQEMRHDPQIGTALAGASPGIRPPRRDSIWFKESQEGASVRVLPAGVYSDGGTSKILLPSLRDEGSVLQPTKRNECSECYAGRSRTKGARPHSGTSQGYVRPAERKESHAESGGACQDDQISSRENVSVERGQWEVDQATDGLGCGGESPYGTRHHDGGGSEGCIPQRPEPLQGGFSGPLGETGNRSGWQHPHHQEVAIPRPPENRDTQLSRVDRVEVLESGRGRGSSPCGGDDPLYDFEVEGTHCYFADGVLVHNCRNASSLTVECFSAAVRQSIPIICASATIALSPLEFRFAGRIVGLHDGGEDWDRFLLRHGCSRKKVGGPWKWNGDRDTLAKIHHRLFPARGCRVRMEDLGADAPETEISVLEIYCPEADNIEAMYRESQATIRRLMAQGESRSRTDMLERNNRLRTWQSSEAALVAPLAERIRQDVRDGWSVAVFMRFTPSRLALCKALNTTAGIYGGVSPKRRDHYISEFQADREHILINNIASGGVSVSLHDLNGDRPRRAYILPTDQLIQLAQAIGRVARVKAVTKSEQFIPCIVSGRGESIMAKMVKTLRTRMCNLEYLNDGSSDGASF